ncbi:MAG TPA: hypothetical protein VK524_10290 [Polyangiaceae bacterium]|nr:hypothetical protein [Polyangiaceae bacterium]
MLPLSPGAHGPAIAAQLAHAVASLASEPVALLSLRSAPGDGARLNVTEVGCAIEGRWLSPTLALVAPITKPAVSEQLPVLKALLAYSRERAGRVIADLSPLVDTDNHQALAACHLFDGVVLLAVTGVTREKEVRRVERELPAERNLGVLLIG